jgi:membrane protein
MAEIQPETASQYRRGTYDTPTEAGASSEPSLAQLLSELLSDGQTLIRKEFTLARQEISDSLDTARQSAIVLGIGAGITAAGGLLLLLSLAHGVAAGFSLPLWLAYLIVGSALAIIGVVALISGVSRLKQVNPVPTESIDSVRKDIQWLKEQTPSDRP